jgi:predicted aspartyl protease
MGIRGRGVHNMSTPQPDSITRAVLTAAIAFGTLLNAAQAATGLELPGPSVPLVAQLPTNESQSLTEIVVRSTEPRFVAPTRRDRIGRIWAPVYINGQGPFRLVLDSGANHSGITRQVAEALGIPLNQSEPVMLRGVTGSATVPTVKVDSFTVGDLQVGAERLPIVTDALGGAEGVLGTDSMANQRIFIDFKHDLISITRSHGDRADRSFRVIPFQTMRGNLLVVDASVGGVRTKAIIDTGGQVTIANMALRQALDRRRAQLGKPTQIEGVTTAIQDANSAQTPPLRFDGVDGQGSVTEFRYRDVSYADMQIFEHWRLTNEPTMLVGMDALGLLDTLVIDYRLHELQLRMRSAD